MTATIKSYRQTREPQFEESTMPPVCLGELNGRVYYAFSKEVTPPSGGKAVTGDEHQALKQSSLLIKQIKMEAMRRILAIAPYWQQNDALADMTLLSHKADLTDEEQARLNNAKQLWECIEQLRQCSNAIEHRLFQGEMVDYMQDSAWQGESEDEQKLEQTQARIASSTQEAK